ncbi:hypothetical protein M0805_000187 [Coniferiporia weirii]|nr:hypothetical protein M0805_000187 [Coniferiporia weirii]
MSVLEQFHAYPFDTDQVFQDGLLKILESAHTNGTDAMHQEYVIGRAKAFYFSSVTNQRISWEEIQSSLPLGLSQNRVKDKLAEEQLKAGASGADNGQHELSLAEISELIESGQTHLIPNNEIVPTGINVQIPSSSNETLRRKPWEI